MGWGLRNYFLALSFLSNPSESPNFDVRVALNSAIQTALAGDSRITSSHGFELWQLHAFG
jgi:hypothetical protein